MKTFDLNYQKIIKEPEELLTMFNEAIKLGFEGIMAKKLDAVYQAGARNFNWVKLKYLAAGKLSDTLDCIVMGYYKGQGKRTGFGIGAFLVGVRGRRESRDSDEEQILTIAKIGTGLTDQQWVTLRKKCGKYAVKNKPEGYEVDKNLTPDAWITPKIVVEIAADEITKSPIHTAKLALRFPRLVNFRDDKSVAEATTISEVENLFKVQNGKNQVFS